MIAPFVGVCQCERNFVESDCSVDIALAPDMIGIPDMGLCDLSLRECGRTAVIAKTFVEGYGLNCRLGQFLVSFGSFYIEQ